ncbi:MAG: aldehyde ferredoxin oxidoreductase [Magnetovibrio sp.]|nr:aldehyde ferredoxin oxidoreductase [Magnetovibrio sp.]
MRKFLDINVEAQTTKTRILSGREIAEAGRFLIAKALLENGAATIDPLSPSNPLIFSGGPFAGSNFSNANRLSVGCKSPLTGGIKESNAGGTFAFALGQSGIAGFTLYGASEDWVVIRISKDGDVAYDEAGDYLGKGLFETAEILHARYGDKVSLGICGPVGEYGGMLGGIAFSDPENRPVRIAARGGVGAVMGSKKIKAIVVDKHKMPPFMDRKKLMGNIKEYGAKLSNDAAIKNMSERGTAWVADLTNHLGGLPVRNFSDGRLVDTEKEVFRMGGDHIREQNLRREGETTHACMPGCMIKCSNVYVDENGKEVVSPLEYETIGLLGTNCGIEDPDEVAYLNAIANDLGIDTIETGAMLATLMDHGQAKFGDVKFMEEALHDIRIGSERGKILAMGTGRVGKHFGFTRIPVIKNQAVSAYDPRVIEVTGISMMMTAQGADHTVGNLPGHDCKDQTTEQLADKSMPVQVACAIADSIGICLFGRSVTNENHELIVNAINAALGTELPVSFLHELGCATLKMEWEFNALAGFTDADNELPAFFYNEPLPPTGKTARHYAPEVSRYRDTWIASSS